MASQGLFSKLIIGDENLPDFTLSQLPKTRWGLWWDTFKTRLGALCKVNLLLLLFLIPIVAVLLFTYFQETAYGMAIPANANFGIGYYPRDDINALYDSMKLNVTLRQYIFLVPCFMLFGVGLAGATYVVRRISWGEGVHVAANFGHGIKENWKQFLGASALLALSFFGMMFCFFGLEMFSSATWLIVIIQVVGVIQFIFILIMYMYFCTQCVTYQLGFIDLVKNSFLFAIGLFPQNLFFMFLAIFPIIFAFAFADLIWLSVIGWILILFVGLANMLLVWTIFNHYVYDKYINDRVEGAVKNRNMATKKSKEEEIADQLEYIRTRNTVYGSAYAARMLSSIDKGHTFTPLTSTFNRRDLVKLSEEKKIMQEEMDKERATAEEQIALAYEEWENMQKPKGKGKRKKK